MYFCTLTNPINHLCTYHYVYKHIDVYVWKYSFKYLIRRELAVLFDFTVVNTCVSLHRTGRRTVLVICSFNCWSLRLCCFSCFIFVRLLVGLFNWTLTETVRTIFLFQCNCQFYLSKKVKLIGWEVVTHQTLFGK